MNIDFNFTATWNWHEIIVTLVAVWLALGLVMGLFKLVLCTTCHSWRYPPLWAKILFGAVLLVRCSIGGLFQWGLVISLILNADYVMETLENYLDLAFDRVW